MVVRVLVSALAGPGRAASPASGTACFTGRRSSTETVGSITQSSDSSPSSSSCDGGSVASASPGAAASADGAGAGAACAGTRTGLLLRDLSVSSSLPRRSLSLLRFVFFARLSRLRPRFSSSLRRSRSRRSPRPERSVISLAAVGEDNDS